MASALAASAGKGLAEGAVGELAKNGVLRVEEAPGCCTWYCCSSGNTTTNSNTRIVVQGGELRPAAAPSSGVSGFLSQLFSCCTPRQPAAGEEQQAVENNLVRNHIFTQLSQTYGEPVARAAMANYTKDHPEGSAVVERDLANVEGQAQTLLRHQNSIQHMAKEIHYYAMAQAAKAALPDVENDEEVALPTQVTKSSGQPAPFDPEKIKSGILAAQGKKALNTLSEDHLDSILDKVIAAIRHETNEQHSSSISTARIKELVVAGMASEGIEIVPPPYIDPDRDADLLQALRDKSRLQDLTPEESLKLYELSLEAEQSKAAPSSSTAPVLIADPDSETDS
jgi:hypothetical protein